ncbi:MAG: prepilin-type N-terminal cleavage/methylation domain-containing protein [Lentisphaerae bacterium]|jgi:type II secretory pathway pseudopilin PulG|nr:prepilin-type N-terminal cleavage/methylation domain-containing protein [Lentisphaerota bacterium]MBT4819957.1 prepilin-type N-terminal cleavage/methylation domain-containing protein [Lentisphaerota bacterium]MBT5610041.1 prepilin-type N-terminal cleavage/methylation domain-containing protein [Lentisphaerota bacterium]MBT7055559.1 prepilin-type N-terminal cleavage/methylation domain-containing protein [Lentisphaerota bacterium]MBT7841486.1 prepilin-type N-terminal cleavage/methylation domain
MRRTAVKHHVHCFTLVELLAAMAVLTIMMGFLFKFLQTAQQAWSLSDSNARIYQNAQIAFDLLGHDLRCAIASDTEDAEIPFWTSGTHDAADSAKQDVICFVAAVEARNDDAESRMVEVKYSHHTDEGGDPDQSYWLRRSLTSDRAGDPAAADPKWDFYGVTSGTVWANSAQNRHHIIDGVEEFEIQTLPSANGTRNTLPSAVRIKLTLIDPEATKANVPTPVRDKIKARSRRTFVKIVFLSSQ